MTLMILRLFRPVLTGFAYHIFLKYSSYDCDVIVIIFALVLETVRIHCTHIPFIETPNFFPVVNIFFRNSFQLAPAFSCSSSHGNCQW